MSYAALGWCVFVLWRIWRSSSRYDRRDWRFYLSAPVVAILVPFVWLLQGFFEFMDETKVDGDRAKET